MQYANFNRFSGPFLHATLPEAHPGLLIRPPHRRRTFLVKVRKYRTGRYYIQANIVSGMVVSKCTFRIRQNLGALMRKRHCASCAVGKSDTELFFKKSDTTENRRLRSHSG